MKFLIAMALVAFAAHVSAQTCTDIEHCGTCANPGPLCKTCPPATIISEDRTKCLDCSMGCLECTTNAQDVTTCTKCSTGYYLKDGACVDCGDGCLECHEANSAVVCDKCAATGYAQDTTQTAKPCLACPSNCKTCSVQTDGSTQCSECYSYSGLNIKGYFLKTADKSCKMCPASCEKCSDNGSGVGICNDCFDNTVSLVDPTDSTKDGTKCLTCPSNCKQCSGEVKAGNNAKCTECKPDMGNYLNQDECISCAAGCKNCDSDGACVECKEKYRLASGSCTACPTFCLTCSVNENNENVCDDCEAKYGVKPTTEVTCDSCGISNCATCTRAADGTFTCTSCEMGYLLQGDACKQCPVGCRVKGCDWDVGTSATICDATTKKCDPAYTDTVHATSGCGACKTVSNPQCKTCDWDATPAVVCSECEDGYHLGASDMCIDKTTVTGCDTYTAGASTCATCKPGFFYDNTDATNPICTPCSSTGCTACAAAAATCTECGDTYLFVDPNCNECTNRNCKTCDPVGTCSVCKAGYYDPTDCKACPLNCGSCGSDGVCTSCAVNYVLDDNSNCQPCPAKCADCTYDATASKTKCKDGSCTRDGVTGYTVNNEGDCEACPEHCSACEYNAELSKVVCSSNAACDEGYGLKADKECHACPNNCKDCDVDAEDKLTCTTCKNNYAKNEDVCAKCPSNCNECSNTDGTMGCTECSAGYALDSSNGACVKCPSNCEKCSATTCQECNSGYALAADRKSCVMCSTAAFANCLLCTNMDASDKANCTMCASGYVLEDEEQHLSCKSTGSLSCGSGSAYDNDAECSTCDSGFQLTDDRKCAKTCHSCGDPDAGTFVPSTECTIPSGNATETDAKPIDCLSGICYAGRNAAGEVNAGCQPTSPTCVTGEGEVCSSLPDGSQLCNRCCTEDLCNKFVADLDGFNDNSGTNMAASLLLLVSAVLLATF